ncbi:MAG TPA: spore coat protein [Mollicutes bacterium]|nr:spore coat protein [Mollicutes bacterium]
MDNNTVSNPETKVPKGKDMNDSDYLNDILSTEKHYGSNYAIVMNEASNDSLYNEIGTICKETKDMARALFNLQFNKGWYRLEQADANKISTISNEYNQKYNELN